MTKGTPWLDWQIDIACRTDIRIPEIMERTGRTKASVIAYRADLRKKGKMIESKIISDRKKPQKESERKISPFARPEWFDEDVKALAKKGR